MSGFGSSGNGNKFGGFGPSGKQHQASNQQQEISLNDIVAGVGAVASKAQAVASAYASQYTSQWSRQPTNASSFHVPRSLVSAAAWAGSLDSSTAMHWSMLS
jgi:hypothetical protein